MSWDKSDSGFVKVYKDDAANEPDTGRREDARLF
jgi:hypothetical protein